MFMGIPCIYSAVAYPKVIMQETFTMPLVSEPLVCIEKYTRNIFCMWMGSMALRFMVASVPLAARLIQILPMNQHA
jgi:hypothetical protein